MRSLDEIMTGYAPRELTDGLFEKKVLGKIARRKRRRRRLVASFSAAALVFLVSILFLLLPEADNAPATRSAHAGLPAGSGLPPEQHRVKEEVPVIENLYFASYDSQSTYLLEQVDETDDGRGI